MNHVHHGSVFIIVLLLLTFFTLWASTVWRETSSMIDVAHKKQQYEQQFRLTEALLEYGIAAAKILYKNWCNDSSSNSATCVFDLWPPLVQSESSKLDSYSGKISIAQHKKKITVEAQLLKKESTVCSVHAILSEPKQEKGALTNAYDVPMLVVTEWDINARS